MRHKFRAHDRLAPRNGNEWGLTLGSALSPRSAYSSTLTCSKALDLPDFLSQFLSRSPCLYIYICIYHALSGECTGWRDFWENLCRSFALYTCFHPPVRRCSLKVAFSLINRHFLLRLRKVLWKLAPRVQVNFGPTTDEGDPKTDGHAFRWKCASVHHGRKYKWWIYTGRFYDTIFPCTVHGWPFI